MPNALLPQSALAVGQTPLQVIRNPQVGVSVPNPLDVTNFYRMQQGQQNNVGILQRNETLRLQQQQADLQNYAMRVKEAEAMMGSIDKAFAQNYSAISSSRKNGASSSSGLTGLDPSKAKHAEIIKRHQDILAGAEAEADQIGRSFLASNSTNPAERYEAVRQIQNTISRAQRDLESDPDYRRYSVEAMNYDTFQGQLRKAMDKGYNVNGAKYDQLMSRYETFVQTGQGSFTPSDWNLSDYVYKGSDVLKNITADAKQLGQGVEERVQVPTSGGGTREGVQTTFRSADDIADNLYSKYMMDPNFQAMYANVAAGRKIQYVDVNGDLKERDYTPRDYIADLSKPYAPIPGKEQIVSKSGSFNYDPQKANGSGSSRSSGTAGGAKKGDPDYVPPGYINIIGGKPADASERFMLNVGLDLQKKGFDVITPELEYSDWYNIQTWLKKDYGEWRDVKDADGNVTAREFWDKGTADIDPHMMYSFPIDPMAGKHGYKFEVPDALPPGTKLDLGARNMNPTNYRPSKSEIAAGIQVDDRGFGVFNSFEEGLQYEINDLKRWKLSGRSNAVKGSKYMVHKYGDAALANYEDFWTLEDWINVRTPKNTFGGDNTPESTDSLVENLERHGFDRDTMMRDITDWEGVFKGIIQMESPHSYAMMYSKSPEDQATIVEQRPANPGETSAPSVAVMTDDAIRFDVADYLLLGDADGVNDDDFQDLMDNPPEELKVYTTEFAEDQNNIQTNTLRLVDLMDEIDRAGLDSLTEDELAEYLKLNSEYKDYLDAVTVYDGSGSMSMPLAFGKYYRNKQAEALKTQAVDDIIKHSPEFSEWDSEGMASIDISKNGVPNQLVIKRYDGAPAERKYRIFDTKGTQSKYFSSLEDMVGELDSIIKSDPEIFKSLTGYDNLWSEIDKRAQSRIDDRQKAVAHKNWIIEERQKAEAEAAARDKLETTPTSKNNPWKAKR